MVLALAAAIGNMCSRPMEHWKIISLEFKKTKKNQLINGECCRPQMQFPGFVLRQPAAAGIVGVVAQLHLKNFLHKYFFAKKNLF